MKKISSLLLIVSLIVSAFAVANERRLEKVAERGEFFSTANLPDCTHGDQIEFLRRVLRFTIVLTY